MLKRIFMVLGIVAFVFGISKLSFAMEGSDMTKEGSMQPSTVQAESVNKQTTAQPSKVESIQKAEEVGNKICPVTGEKIDEATKATYEYEGKIYNFCCPMCIDEFKKDPDKYIKKIEEEMQAMSKKEIKEEKGTNEPAAHGGMGGMHEGHQH